MPKAKALTPDQIAAATGHDTLEGGKPRLDTLEDWGKVILPSPKTVSNRKPLNLLTHCGSQKVTLEKLRAYPTPQPDTLTHVIVPHCEVLLY